MKDEWKGIALVLVAGCLWGVSGSIGQFLFEQRGLNVEWLMSVRMLVSGTLLLLLSAFRKGTDLFTVWRTKRDREQLLIFGLLGMLPVQYTFFAAIKHSNAATATILQFTGPVFIALYLALRYKKPLRAATISAIVLALSGTFLLVTHGSIQVLKISVLALLLGMASAVSLAIYTLQPMALLRSYSAATIIGWGLLIGGIGISFAHAPWQVEGNWDAYTYASVAYIIVLGTLAPFYAYLIAVKIIGGQTASLLNSAEPLSAAVLSVWWLGVPFTFLDWIGTLLIISTVFMLALDKRQNTPPSFQKTVKKKTSTRYDE